jgi:uncharacterized RDD family membrane protein YckC
VPPPGYYVPAPPGHPPGAYHWHTPPPPPLSPAGVPLADFGTRLLAYLIDTALLSVILLVVALPAMFVAMFRLMPTDEELPAQQDPFWAFQEIFVPILLIEAGLVVFSLLCYYVYAVEYMHRTGQTLGKRLMKIRVVPIDPDRTLTRGMAAKRYLVEYVVGVVVPFFHYLDGLWQLWDKPYQQALHDKAARTVVVKVSP